MIAYFPPGYFAPGYWATGYWAEAGTAPPPPPTTGIDLLSAVKALFDATPALTRAITGGYYFGEISQRRTMPYVVGEEVRNGLELATSTSKYFRTTIRFRVFAPDLDAAGNLGDLIEQAYKEQVLAYQNGFTSPLVLTDRKHVKGAGLVKGSVQSWHLLIEFTCRTKRTI